MHTLLLIFSIEIIELLPYLSLPLHSYFIKAGDAEYSGILCDVLQRWEGVRSHIRVLQEHQLFCALFHDVAFCVKLGFGHIDLKVSSRSVHHNALQHTFWAPQDVLGGCVFVCLSI